MVLVVRKKDDRNKKTSHLILEMSMNEVYIWLSGHRFIDREISNGEKFLMARICFRIFTENNPARGTGKNIIYPT